MPAASLPEPRSTLLTDVTRLASVLSRTLQGALIDPNADIDDRFLRAAGALLNGLDSAAKALAGGYPSEAREVIRQHAATAVDDYDAARHAYKALQALHGPREAVPVVHVEGDVTPEQVAEIVEAFKRGNTNLHAKGRQ